MKLAANSEQLPLELTRFSKIFSRMSFSYPAIMYISTSPLFAGEKQGATPGRARAFDSLEDKNNQQHTLKILSKRPSELLINFIAQFEELKLSAYICPGGKLTIGYGHTRNVKKGDTLKSQEQAEVLLVEDIMPHHNLVKKLFDKFQLEEHQIDALTSASFNCGCLKGGKSKFAQFLTQNLPLLDDPDKGTETLEKITSYLCKFNMANGKFLDGLLRRRLSEGLMLAGVANPYIDSKEYKTIKAKTLALHKDKSTKISELIPEMVHQLFIKRGIIKE